MARRHGADDATIENLHQLERTSLGEADRAAIRFAERMTTDMQALGDDDIETLRQHFDDDQIVEITCVVGLFNYLNRFAEATGLWPTRPGEGGPQDLDGEGSE